MASFVRDFNPGQGTAGPSVHCSQASCRALRPEVLWATGLNSVKDKPLLFLSFPLPGDTLQRASSIISLPGPTARHQTDRQTGDSGWVPDSEHSLSLSPLNSWPVSLLPPSPPSPAANNQLHAAPLHPAPSPASCQSAGQQRVEGSSTPR